MGGVYCPTCEAGVEVTARFCLSCGHDLNVQGPITATGHDLNQLKDVIRIRDDLSMAEKFDMIAQIETGADPIALGIAAAGDGEPTETTAVEAANQVVAPGLRNAQWGHPAAEAAIELATNGTKLADLKAAGAFEKDSEAFAQAMDIGRTATLHLLEVSQGAVLPASDALAALPVMQPPNKSFCPKCGSDIHANAMLQWKKWTDMSTDGLTIQIEAAMQASLMHLAAAYRDEIQDLKDQLSDAQKGAEKAASTGNSPAKQEAKDKKDDKKDDKKTEPPSPSPAKAEKPKEAAKPAPAKPKAGGLFGAKKAKKTYEGEPGGKADWFLEEALDTVYDPHGTGKPIKGAMILARSAEGNVRVRDVIRAYAVEGEDGISELAWTSPITKYLIEAYDAC
jgi:hypothetical protein